MLQVYVIPALRDNYIFFLKDDASGLTAVVDPSESKPVEAFLKERGERLDFILNTHHHWDHTGGNLDLQEKYNCKIIGHSKDAKRIPGINEELAEGDSFNLGESCSRVISIDGHTLGHIAFYFEASKKLFCGDTLFSMGCGRLFEGSAEQMFESLGKLKQLPDDTQVYCAHEYTLDNISFALSRKPNDAELLKFKAKVEVLRQDDQPSVPSLLGDEKKLNPFLLAGSVEEFASERKIKDRF